jgi:hypothetical protein
MRNEMILMAFIHKTEARIFLGLPCMGQPSLLVVTMTVLRIPSMRDVPHMARQIVPVCLGTPLFS